MLKCSLVFYILHSAVNVVIFAGGKLRENVNQTVHVGVCYKTVESYLRINYSRMFCRVGIREKHQNYPPANFFTFTVYNLILFILFHFYIYLYYI